METLLTFLVGVATGVWLTAHLRWPRRARPDRMVPVRLVGGPADGQVLPLTDAVQEYHVARADEDGNELGPTFRYVRTTPETMAYRGRVGG